MIYTTASALRAILAFIDPSNTPKIAYDRDDMAIPLIEKMKQCVGDNDGSQRVYLSFSSDEEELMRQFNGVCNNMKSIFDMLGRVSD